MQVVRLQAPESPGMLLDLQEYVQPQGKVSDGETGRTWATPTSASAVPNMADAYRELSEEGVKFVSEPVSFRPGLGRCPRCLL